MPVATWKRTSRFVIQFYSRQQDCCIATTTDKDWAAKSLEMKLFDFNPMIHPSTEAFFLLVIENNYDLYIKEYTHQDEMAKIKKYQKGSDRTKAMKELRDKNNIPKPKYTGHGGTRCNDGWSPEGQKERYNVLYDKVLQDRKKEGHREAFDQLFYNHYKAMKATVATVTHKEESVMSPIKMRFRGRGSEPEIIGEPEEV